MAAEIAAAPYSGSNWLHRLFVGSARKGLALTFDCFDPTPALGAAEEGVVGSVESGNGGLPFVD